MCKVFGTAPSGLEVNGRERGVLGSTERETLTWLTTSFSDTIPIFVLKVLSPGKSSKPKKTGTGGHPVWER